MEKIILASASPRRKEILKSLGVDFEIVTADADEGSISTDTEPKLYVQELAFLKATATARELLDKKKKHTLIIAADTVVVSDGKILGKPKDKNDAFDMLRGLSAKTHKVMTGICVFRLDDAFSVCDTVTTEVTFKDLSDDIITSYIATGEPMDKAGAYGIQGRGSLLCSGILGDYFNVVGLPASRLCDILYSEFGYKL